MAYQRYQGYQYETSPRKIQPEYEKINNPYKKKKSSVKNQTKKKEKNQKNKNVKQKTKVNSKAKLILGIAVTFCVLFAISYQNSLITESFNEKESLKKKLSAIEKENEQLKVNIEKSLNLNNVEQSAKEMLGMQKLDNSQKVYVSIPKEDYVESETEKIIVEEETNWFDKLIEAVKSIFK